MSMRRAATWCAAWARPAGSTRAVERDAGCAHDLPRARNPGTARGTGGFRVRDAGARHGARGALRSAALRARVLPPTRGGDSHRGLRAERAGRRQRRRRPRHHGGKDRRRVAHRRREDVHLQRRHRRPLRGVRAHAARRRARAAFPPSMCRADAPGLTVAERIEIIAPHPLARLRFENCVVPDEALLGAAGRGVSRSPWRRWISSAPRVGAAALGFARRALDEALARATAAAHVRRPARRIAARRRRSSRTWRWRSTPPRCSSIAPPGRATCSSGASRARRRWRSCTRPRRRSG